MQDFLLRFSTCSDPTNYDTCHFKTAIEGLVVGLLSIGTLFGALIGGEGPALSILRRRTAYIKTGRR